MPTPSTRLRATLPAVFLFALNAVLIHQLFADQYTVFRGSGEATYIALARYTLAHFPDLGWFPLWYGGIPMQNAYPPLLYSLTAIWALVARISPALAYHQFAAIVYCAAPVTLYCLLTRLGASTRAAWLSGLAYSLLSPTAILVPLVAGDVGGRWNPRRLQVLLAYGEGSHELAIALIPLALIALHLLLSRRTPARFALAACAIAAVALTDWHGSYALALAILCYLIVQPSLRNVAITGGAALLAYGLVCPWLPPWTLATVQRDTRLLTPGYDPLRILVLLAACAFCVAISWLLRKRNLPAAWSFFTVFAIVTAIVVLPAFRWHWPVLPQADRYHLEMDLALCGLAGLLFDRILRRLPPALVLATAAWFGIVGSGQVVRLYQIGLDYTRHDDATRWTEYRAASWLQQNLHTGRAFLPGSFFFWLNAWTGVPQVGGGFNNGIFNWQTDIAEYVIDTGEGAGSRDAEISRLWLEALGVHAFAVSESNGSDWFHSIRNPQKFAGLFPEAWRDGHDVIYSLDRVPGDLAHLIPAGALVSRPPANGVDVAQIAAYVSALEASDPNAATMRWQNQHTLAIHTHVTAPGQILTLQENWHPGWLAQANGKPLNLHPDGLGLMAIGPLPPGDYNLAVTYQPPTWPWLLSGLSLLLVLGLSGRKCHAT